MRAGLALLVAVGLALGAAVSCLDLSWKEGIACDGEGHCPGGFTCCGADCRRECPPADAGNADGPVVVVCPTEAGGCFACMPGCPCTCGASSGTCRLEVAVTTCATTP